MKIALRRTGATFAASEPDEVMISTSNSVSKIEVGQLIVCILGFILGLAGVVTLTAWVGILGFLMLLGGFGCFALQQALGD